MTFKNAALIVCTRNRPVEVGKLLGNLKTKEELPGTILIVDSSENAESRDILESEEFKSLNIIYVASSPGLPHQRNVGIDYLRKNELVNSFSYVHFIDDDVLLPNDYFQIAEKLIQENPRTNFFGAYDKSTTQDTYALKVYKLFIRGGLSGVILKNGHAYPPKNIVKLTSVEFTAGHSFIIRWPAISPGMFNNEIRIYGEDLDFQLRLGLEKRWLVSPNFFVSHLMSKTNRSSARLEAKYTDAFRYRIVIEYPQYFSRQLYYLSLVLGIVIATVRLLSFRPESASRLVGHLEFAISLARGNPIKELSR